MPQPLPLHALYERAVDGLRRNDLVGARRDCEALLAAAPKTPEVLHLTALVLMESGDALHAERYFRAAGAMQPADPVLASNFGKCLLILGHLEEAAKLFHEALKRSPDFADALLGLAETCIRLDDSAQASQLIAQARLLIPDSARPGQILARLCQRNGDSEGATNALDEAAIREPGDLTILLDRAQLAIDLGDDPQSWINRARIVAPDDEQFVLTEAAARVAAGQVAEARDALNFEVGKRPRWLEGHRVLAQLSAQLGDASAIDRQFEAAIAQAPLDWPLSLARVRSLQSRQQWRQSIAAVDAVRAAAPDSPEILRGLDDLVAVALDELGDIEEAARAFAAVDRDDNDIGFQLGMVRHLLRRGEAAVAAERAERLARATAHGGAWAYAATAWRLLGDPRWQWLEGDDRLVSTIDIDAARPMLGDLGDELRRLHVNRSHPINQSVRGGTQTHGHLFRLRNPVIAELRALLEGAVRDHIDQLPPYDKNHPTLSAGRNSFRVAGSWSVRLSGGGFHIGHVHPQGWISSAFYVALPVSEAADDPTAGWLELGLPPADLGLALAPISTIEPRPGRLVLFPSTMWHGTRSFREGERLTVAFDVVSSG